MIRLLYTIVLCVFIWSPVQANGVLDGRTFTGMLGPEENPDHPDSLHFSDGYFWSDICTRCGFKPGAYTTKPTDDGIAFSGVLESESRGQFTYDGLVREDGQITVSIQWERRRWYWTSRRKIAFLGKDSGQATDFTVEEVRLKLKDLDTSSNPLCARF